MLPPPPESLLFALTTKRAKSDGRERLLAIHGNRFNTHLVLSCLVPDFTSRHHAVTPEEEKLVTELTVKVFDSVFALLNTLYPYAYLASPFKNATKCQGVKAQFQCP